MNLFLHFDIDVIMLVSNSLNAVIIAKNEARSINRCIQSVLGFVDRVLVLDTGSCDDTVNIARAVGAYLFERQWHANFSM